MELNSILKEEIQIAGIYFKTYSPTPPKKLKLKLLQDFISPYSEWLRLK